MFRSQCYKTFTKVHNKLQCLFLPGLSCSVLCLRVRTDCSTLGQAPSLTHKHQIRLQTLATNKQYFQPSLMNASKDGAYPIVKYILLNVTLPTNIRLGGKGKPRINIRLAQSNYASKDEAYLRVRNLSSATRFRIGSLPYPQTLDQAGKARQGQTLQLIKQRT